MASIQLTNDKSTRPGSYWRAGMFWRSHCGGWEHFKSWWNQLDGWFLLGQDFLYTERPEIPVLGQDQQPTDLPGDKDHAIIIYNGILYGILSSSIMEYHHHHYMGYYSNWSDNNYNIMTGWCFGTWLLWLSTIYIYGMSSFPLTFTHIFQDVILFLPPTRWQLQHDPMEDSIFPWDIHGYKPWCFAWSNWKFC